MKVAILGARGFLGSFLCQHLAATSHTVIPVTRETLDLADYTGVQDWLSWARPDAVINCAVSGGGTRVDEVNFQDFQNDLEVFLNFYNSEYKFRYINVGSGAEFDRRTNIDKCSERDIFTRHPASSYGYVKNTISRLCVNKPNFYTLRLFGCFDRSESDFRLFRRFLKERWIKLNDRYFDYISASDFAVIIERYLSVEDDGLPGDINCVYREKLRLSDILAKFAEYHLPEGVIEILPEPAMDYTGDSSKLDSMHLALAGLERGIRVYL